MPHRTVIEASGCRWDKILAVPLERPDPDERPTISIGGLVDGPDGALILRLPGMVDRFFALAPPAARALRDALVARVSDAAEPTS